MKTVITISAFIAATLLLSSVGNAATVYEKSTTVQVFLLVESGIVKTVLKVAVPAGVWVVQTKAQAVNFGAQTVARCQIRVGTTLVNSSAATQIGSGAGLPFVAMLGNQGVVTTTSRSPIIFECGHTEGNQSGIYLDPGASLIVYGGPRWLVP